MASVTPPQDNPGAQPKPSSSSLPPLPVPVPSPSTPVHLLGTTPSGGRIVSFGRPASIPPAAPANDLIQQLRNDLRAFGYNRDAAAFQRLCLNRRHLAPKIAEVPADHIESFLRSDLGRQHPLLANSRLPLLPAPAEDLPFIQSLEERLAAAWSIGTYLAGLLFRPARHWKPSLRRGDIPPWLFQAYPSQLLAPSQTDVSPEDRQAVAQLFADAGLDPTRTIALFAGGEDAAKSYPNLGLALKPLCATGNWHVVAIGSAADAPLNQRCLQDSAAKSADWSGQLSFPQMVEVLRLSRLALGIEHPLAHIACALDTPNVLVLGGGSFGISLPYSPSTSIVTFPLTCFSCSWQCRFARPHCVKDAPPEVVELAVREALANKPAHPRLYQRHPSFVKIPPGTEPFINVDLLPPMLLEFVYATSDHPDLKLPAAVSGCPVRAVPLPSRVSDR